VTARVALALAVGLMWVLPVFGASRQHRPAVPDPELIEFLGGFETAGGTAVDPLVFADEEKPKGPATDKRKAREQQRKKPAATTRRETEGTEQ
jgi:hypothetical protein